MSETTPENETSAEAANPVERMIMPSASDSAVELYAIPMLYETQKEPLDKYCFGSCGKISISGVIDIPEVGPCWVCTHADCKHEKGHTDIIGASGITGEPVRVRGLEA